MQSEEARPGSSPWRVFRNTAVQLTGDITGKLLTFGFLIFMARHLGQQGFGDFVFSLSLSLLCTVIAGFGTDAILTREVVKAHDRINDLFWTAVEIKLAVGAVAVAVAFSAATIGGYDSHVRLAVVLFGFASVIDLVTKTIGATFQAHHDLRPFAAAGVIQRLWTAAAGIAVLAALRGGVVDVAAIYLGGSVLALAYASRALVARGLAPPIGISAGNLRWLFLTAFPIGLTLIFNTIVFRADATILSLMKGSAAVGIYGAGYQLLESTLFISYAFVAAIWPTLSQLGTTTRPTIGQVYERACKVLASLLLPLGAGFVLFGGPVTRLVYGGGYADAVTTVRLLGGAVALYGLSYLSSYALIALDRPAILAWVTAAVAAENVGLNVLLIPHFSFDGAAAATSISEVSSAVLFTGFVIHRIGRVSPTRVLLGPVLGCGTMTAVALVVGANLPALAIAVLSYVVVLFVVEHRLYPEDVRFTLDAVRRSRAVG